MAAVSKSTFTPVYDRKAELIAFDETKTGVKGVVDAGITEIPRMFVVPSPEIQTSNQELTLPTIDLEGINEDPIRRKEVIEQVKDALGTWGFFQMVNHGIPVSILEEMKKGIIRFFEQDSEVKKQWYTRDFSRKVLYNSNFDLYTAPVTNWRDSLFVNMSPNPPQADELPPPCRDIFMEYASQVTKVKRCILEVMSEALGLDPNHLSNMDCAEKYSIASHYYPACPQPEIAIGTTEHTDGVFITILLQDHIGGLKVFYQNQWTHVPPTPGALIVNGGDLLQLVTNDMFVSSRHKVVANKVGPRVSVASFFSADLSKPLVVEPIKELVSDDNPAKYRGTTAKEFTDHILGKPLDGTSGLLHFKI